MGAGEVVGLLSGTTGASPAPHRGARPERELSCDLRQALWKKNPPQYTKTKALDHENEDKGMKGHQARRATMRSHAPGDHTDWAPRRTRLCRASPCVRDSRRDSAPK